MIGLLNEEALRQLVAQLVGEAAARPEHVTQRTVLAVVGMPARDYLRHCREGDWPSYSDRRLRYSRTADVLAWIASQRSESGSLTTPAEFQRSRSGIRRVG